MKFTLKFVLVISLFSSIAFAEGDQGSGGFTDGDQGSGGRTCTQNCIAVDQTDKATKETNSFLEYVQEFLEKILG